MKRLNALILLSPIILVIFLFTSCDMDENPVGTFGDIMNKVPRFEPIAGAENVTVKVTDDGGNSTFRVNLSNLDATSSLLAGDYTAWCGLWRAPLDTEGREYSGIKAYSTLGDPNFNKVNYLLNYRRSYANTIEGVTPREIQAALWLLLKYKEYNIDEDQAVNKAAVNQIMADVNRNGGNFTPAAGQITAVFLDLSIQQTNESPTQTIILEECETAMARMNDDPEDFTYQWAGHPWFSYLVLKPTAEKQTFFFYAGQHYRVGEVDIWKDGSNLYIDIRLVPGVVMTESHVNVQLDNSEYTTPAAFGTWPYDDDDRVSDYLYEIPWNNDWDDEDLYIGVHGVVCPDLD
jgi:hypothetical protein